MEFTPDRAAKAFKRHLCPKCEGPAGSACRTLGGKTASKYHTARFALVPASREELEAPVSADHSPGKPWKQRPPVETALKLASDIKDAQPDQVVILTVHEMKRLARNAAELMLLSATSQQRGKWRTAWKADGDHGSVE